MSGFGFSLLIPIIAIVGGCAVAIVASIAAIAEKKKYYEAVTRTLDSGKDIKEIKALLGHEEEKEGRVNYLKWGITTLSVGIGIGIVGLFFIESKAIVGR